MSTNNKNENVSENKTLEENISENKTDELLKIEARIDEKIKELGKMSDQLTKQAEALDVKGIEIAKQAESLEKKLPEITDKMLTESSLKVKEQLDKMPKKHVRIPIDERNPKDLVVPVTISGYTYQIKRGESVEVPEEVERILIEAKYI